MLKLPRALADAMRRHAERDYPQECCGVLLGQISDRDGEQRVAIEVRACANAITGEASRERYSIAPAELVAAQRAARERGLLIVGFYHSHPDHPAQPSVTDNAEAYWPECVYVIVNVALGKAGELRGFRLAGNGAPRLETESVTILE